MKCKLNDVASVTKLAGFEFTKYIKYIPDGEIIAVRALNLKGGTLLLDDVRRISNDVSKSLERSKLCKNDIVLSYTGTIGECAQITENNKYHLAPNVCKITPNVDKVNPDFLFQYVRSPLFKQTMLNYCHGSTQPTIPMATIRELPINIPLDILKQSKVAHILMCFDKKIATNTAINKNLESQAQAIYYEMFIKNSDPTWKTGTLAELVTVKYGKDHKKLDDGKYPVYGSGGIMRFVVCPLYDKESVLIPRKGTLNNVMYVNKPFWSVDTMFYTEMKQPNVAKFVFHFVKGIDLASLNAGSAVPSMTTAILNAIPLKLPDSATLEQFEQRVTPMYEIIQSNQTQSKYLANLRDTLLPRLMSGEIDVGNVEV